MKILMVLGHFFPPDIRIEKEAKVLIKEGHEVFLSSPMNNNSPYVEELNGIKILRFDPPGKFLERIKNYIYYQLFFIKPSIIKTLLNVIKQYKIDAIHIHDLPLVKTGLVASRISSIPLIADLHENYPESIKVWGRTLKGKILNILQFPFRWKANERHCLEKADYVITVVDEMRQSYIQKYSINPNKVKVVMNLEDLDHFLSIPINEDIKMKYKDYFNVLYVGGFGPHRGIQTVINALPAIIPTIGNVHLTLVGSGPNDKQLRELVKKKNLNDYVEFTGWVPFTAVPSYIYISQVCIIPYINTIHTNASCPHKLFQYMAMSKPIVVSSMASLKRIINETGAGIYFNAEDSQSFANAIIKLFKNEHARNRLGKLGVEAVNNKYNWKTGSADLLNIYRELKK
jgi:glycosyltransferase involved in cell wall biosynthesis